MQVPLPEAGQRVQALTRLSWSAEEFEDFPTIVEPGGQGTVTEVVYDENENKHFVFADWDDDEFKHLKKSVGLDENPIDWPIKVIN